jgi:hypothetical protein
VKVILSRKGFDTSWGGGASPILPDERMLPLPIPERAGAGEGEARYVSLQSPTGTTYLELLRSLFPGKEFKMRGKRQELDEETCAHLDPDLIRSVRSRDGAWRGLVGQSMAAAGHLLKQDVGPGDLFLFWGLFRAAEHGSDGRLRFVREAHAFHAIWGYLQVASVLDAGAGDAVPWAPYHPHFAVRDRGHPNIVYTGRPALSWSESCGWGVFRFREALRLTTPGSVNVSDWRLPALFGPASGVSVTYLDDATLWTEAGKYVSVSVLRQKQELVVSESPAVTRWARNLVTRSETWA